MVKVDIPPSISKEAVLRVLQKTDKAEMDSYSEERNPDKRLLEIETYKFSQKNVVNLQCNYETQNHSNSANMDRVCCHFWKVAMSFSKRNFSHFERITIHYQTLQIWIGLNVTHYHNLNALPHALSHAFLYIFSEICLVLGYLQRVITRYHHFF